MVWTYLFSFEKELSESDKEKIFGVLNEIYDDGNKLKESKLIEVIELLE